MASDVMRRFRSPGLGLVYRYTKRPLGDLPYRQSTGRCWFDISLRLVSYLYLVITMAPDTAPKIARPGGLSLYANLLGPSSNKESAPGTISRAPVVFKQSAGEDAQQDGGSTGKQQISAGRY